MKTNLRSILTFALILIAFGCSELELKNSKEYPNFSVRSGDVNALLLCCDYPDFTEWRSTVSTVLTHDFTEYDQYLGSIVFDTDTPTYVYVNPFKLTKYNIPNLMENTITDFNLDSLSKDITEAITPYPYTTGPRSYANWQTYINAFPNVSTYLTTAQRNYLAFVINNMEDATSKNQADVTYTNAINTLNAEPVMTLAQKAGVQTFLELAHEFAVSYFQTHTTVPMVNDLLVEAKRAQPSGCNISFRDAFRDAVWGFFAGAIPGAIYGGTGGTFVLPGVGTVTGAVGGFWVGGAGGFLSGFGASVAQQWFWKCLMKSPISDPELDCANFEFSSNNLEYCNFDLQTHGLIWYLNN